jgi:catechol 2,3-dioxygenase-like lactoylglutathione lyase family enzyme
MNAISLSVSLTVKDVNASVAWYCDVLGFTITQEHERAGTSTEPRP